MSGQDNATLPTRVANHSARFGSSFRLTEIAYYKVLSCPLRTTHCVPQEKFPKRHVINPLLIKLVQLAIGLILFFFLRVYGSRLYLGS